MGKIRLGLDTREASRMAAVVREALTSEVTDALVEAMGVLQRGARQRAPKRSGALADSIGLYVDGPTRVSVSTGLIYATAQEFGARIAPKSARVLRFAVGTGRLVFTRRPVRIDPQPFFQPTWDADAGKAENEFADAIDRKIR